ncbi:TadE family type IV pilus minor pilin [Sinomonas soli]
MRRVRGVAGAHEGPASPRGSVTAEFAVAVPAVILLLGFLLGAVSAAVCQVRVEEAARAGARAVARGEDPGTVAREIARVAGAGTEHSIDASAGVVTVRVSTAVPGPVAAAAGLRAQATASLSREAPP